MIIETYFEEIEVSLMISFPESNWLLFSHFAANTSGQFKAKVITRTSKEGQNLIERWFQRRTRGSRKRPGRRELTKSTQTTRNNNNKGQKETKMKNKNKSAITEHTISFEKYQQKIENKVFIFIFQWNSNFRWVFFWWI